MDTNAAIRAASAEPRPQPKENLRERVQSLRLPDEHEQHGSRKRWQVWLVSLAAVATGRWVGYKFFIQGDTTAATGAKPATSGYNHNAAFTATSASYTSG